jgi:hypothetical protein
MPCYSQGETLASDFRVCEGSIGWVGKTLDYDVSFCIQKTCCVTYCAGDDLARTRGPCSNERRGVVLRVKHHLLVLGVDYRWQGGRSEGDQKRRKSDHFKCVKFLKIGNVDGEDGIEA